jgi:hypothetical protein
MFLSSELHHIRHLLRRENRLRLALSAGLFFFFLLHVTPRVPHSPSLHLFADMRTLLAGPWSIYARIENSPFFYSFLVSLIE